MQFSGKCLCGSVTYTSYAEPTLILNCHCEDCRRSTGAVYGTNVFVPEDQVQIYGEVSFFSHTAKSGNIMTKRFCKKCGTLLFGNSSGRENILSIRAGTIDQTDMIKPVMNVFVSSQVSSTPLDPDLNKTDEMPIGQPWLKETNSISSGI